MSQRFADKVALVTGAASGIGEAIAHQLAREGAAVVVADLEQENVDRVARAITEQGGKAKGFAMDVSQAEANEAAVSCAIQHFGALHHAVNNAGIGGPAGSTADYPIEGWQRVIDVNLNGVFYGLKYQIPAMIGAGGGSIVNMASILGSVGFAGAPAYVAAKHAVVGLTKNAALEYADKGIRINSVGPGFIKTPLVDAGLDAEAQKFIVSQHAQGRMGTSKEVSELTCFLLSDQASFITGSYHLVDGGYTAR